MLNILITIVLFTVMLAIFKWMGRFGVNNLQVIVVNYLVAGICGLVASGRIPSYQESIGSTGFYHALMVGLLFITVFNALAIATQKTSMAIATVANKMSLVVPISAAFILYDEPLNAIKIIAILLAFAGIFMTSTNKGGLSFSGKYLPLILFIFLGQGAADAVFNDAHYLQYTNEYFFSIIFLAAGLAGCIGVLWQVSFKHKSFAKKSLLWGVLLGIPNYGTLHFMDLSLSSSGLNSSEVYPVVNMGIILASAITGILLFKENLGPRNWLGVALSVLAIALIVFV